MDALSARSDKSCAGQVGCALSGVLSGFVLFRVCSCAGRAVLALSGFPHLVSVAREPSDCTS